MEDQSQRSTTESISQNQNCLTNQTFHLYLLLWRYTPGATAVDLLTASMVNNPYASVEELAQD